MHVLIVPSELYQPAWRHTSGIFQRHEAAALAQQGHRAGVLSVGFLTVTSLLHALRAGAREENDVDAADGVPVARMWIPLPLPYRWLPPHALCGVVKFAARRAFKRYIAQFGIPDVIHGHDPLWGGWITNLLARNSGRASVITIHTSAFARGLASPPECDLAGRVLRNAAVVSAVSKSLATSLCQQFGIEEPAVLANVVDEDFLRNKRAPRHERTFVFLSAGSLDANKNHALLLEAFARCFRGASAKLRVAGDGPRRSMLEAQARMLGIDAQVSFLGCLDKSGMLRELGAADCFVLSSRYETFGVVLIEALASGVPIVSTRCGGPEDLVTPECGLIVQRDDAEALSSAMRRIHESREAYDPERLRQYAVRKFGARTYVEQLASLSVRAAPMLRMRR